MSSYTLWEREEAEMTKFLAGVLSVIAVGVLLIAYGLLNPRGGTFDTRLGAAELMQPAVSREEIMLRQDPYLMRTAYVDRTGRTVYQAPSAPVYGSAPYYAPQPAPRVVEQVRPVRTVSSAPAASPEYDRVVERKPGRNWKKTAMVIGGSSAAGAGLGAIFGGKKGALIGAAIGGGASTIYETTKK
jgi:hypothetical protein